MKSNVGGKVMVKSSFVGGLSMNPELSTKSMSESREIRGNPAKSMSATKVLILHYNPKFIFLMNLQTIFFQGAKKPKYAAEWLRQAVKRKCVWSEEYKEIW